MAKKKKTAASGAAAPVAAAADHNASASAAPPSSMPSSTTAAAAPAASPAPAVVAVAQPWASNYDAMKLWPIQQDHSLFQATDSLADKVNQSVGAAAPSSDAAAASTPAAAASGAAAVARFQFGIYNSKQDDAGRRAIAHGHIAAGQRARKQALPVRSAPSLASFVSRCCLFLPALSLSPGTLLLRERGQPWITHAEHADKVCHACAACLYDHRIITAPLPDGKKAPSRHLHCKECEGAFYCSVACQQEHAPVHKLECAALEQCDDMSDLAKVSQPQALHASSLHCSRRLFRLVRPRLLTSMACLLLFVFQCNVDLIRAAIKYVVSKGLQAQAEAAKATAGASASSSVDAAPAAAPTVFDPYHFLSTPSDCELLMDHLSAVSPIDLRNMRDAAALILKALPPDFALPLDSIASFMNRLNSNCHALHLEEYPTIQFGFGLYPLCAIFNHSCYPNCTHL